jgi:hypothetical protein
MSTLTRSPTISTRFNPARVATSSVDASVNPSARTYIAKHRMPLPHISPIEPSEFT